MTFVLVSSRAQAGTPAATPTEGRASDSGAGAHAGIKYCTAPCDVGAPCDSSNDRGKQSRCRGACSAATNTCVDTSDLECKGPEKALHAASAGLSAFCLLVLGATLCLGWTDKKIGACQPPLLPPVLPPYPPLPPIHPPAPAHSPPCPPTASPPLAVHELDGSREPPARTGPSTRAHPRAYTPTRACACAHAHVHARTRTHAVPVLPVLASLQRSTGSLLASSRSRSSSAPSPGAAASAATRRRSRTSAWSEASGDGTFGFSFFFFDSSRRGCTAS